MTVHELARIAARHNTYIARVTLAACRAWAKRKGVALDVGAPLADEHAGTEWERLVRGNRDTRRLHM